MTLKQEIILIQTQTAKIAMLRTEMEDELKALNSSQTISSGYASEATLPMLPIHHPFYPGCCKAPAYAAAHDWLSCFAHDEVLKEIQ